MAARLRCWGLGACPSAGAGGCGCLAGSKDLQCCFSKTKGAIDKDAAKPTSSQLLNLITLEIFLQQETKTTELLFFSRNKRIKATFILGENIMFIAPLRDMS